MSLINLFVAARAALAGRRQRQRAYDELAALDDRSLADIGLHRTQLSAFVANLQSAVPVAAAPVAARPSVNQKGVGLAVARQRLRQV